MANAIWNEKEKRWRIDATRESFRKTFTSVKPGEAGARAVKRRYNAWLSGITVDTTIKVNKLYPMFLENVEKKTGKGENYKRHEKYGRLYIIPKFGNRKMASLTDRDWQNFINTVKPAGRMKRDKTRIVLKEELSKKTLGNLREVIMSFCRYAVSCRTIEVIPTCLYVPKSAQEGEKGILQPQQLRILFSEPSGAYWYLHAWQFMAATGLRPGECYGMQPGDIENDILTISRSIDTNGDITPGKNKNARRRVYLRETAKQILSDQKHFLESKGFGQSDWIFPGFENEQPTPKTSYSEFKRFTAKHGIEGSPYRLRHTWISLMKNDMPEAMIKAAVGHSETMDTLRTYGHEVSGELEKSAQIVDLVFSRTLKRCKAKV